jgi:hypothetical protein
MASQNISDFLNTLGVIGATTTSQPKTAKKADEKSKLSQEIICVFVDTAITNDCSFYKFVCLFQILAIFGMESIEYSIVLILIL